MTQEDQRPDPQQDGAKQIRNYVSFFRRRKAITRSLHDSSSPLGILEPTFSRCPETLGRRAVEINSRRKALRSARWPSGRLRLHACARAAAIGYRRVSPGLPSKLAGTNECARESKPLGDACSVSLVFRAIPTRAREAKQHGATALLVSPNFPRLFGVTLLPVPAICWHRVTTRPARDSLGDLLDADVLPGKCTTEVDVATTDADTPAAADSDDAIVQGICSSPRETEPATREPQPATRLPTRNSRRHIGDKPRRQPRSSCL